MKYTPEPEPDDTDLPGDWKGGEIHQNSQEFRRIFVNESRELCIWYTSLGDQILLERLHKMEDKAEKEPWNRKEILYYQAGCESGALDKSIIMMERVENGRIEYD